MMPKNSSSVSKASSPSGFLGQGTIDIIVAPRMLRCSKCRINQGGIIFCSLEMLLRHDGSIPLKDSMGDGNTSVSSMAYTQHQGSSHYGCVFHPLINSKNLAYGITTDSPKQSGVGNCVPPHHPSQLRANHPPVMAILMNPIRVPL